MDGLLWLYGPSGVGKTSVGWELFRRLEGPVGYVDADQVGLCYPPSGDDPDNHRLKARNVAAVSGTFRRAGARSLIVSGYLNSAEVRDAYAARLPAEPVVWCRLRVDERELRERFGRRGWAPHLVEQTVAEAEELDRTDFADLCVDTSGMSVAEVADQVWGRVAGRQDRSAVAGNGAGPGPSTGPGPATGPAGGPVPVLWLCGPPAVGKSSVGYEVFTQVNRSGVRAAYLDLAQVGFCRPAPDEVRISNLAAVWANHLAAGARCLVMTGQVTSDEVVGRYAGALPGATLTVCRLGAGADELVERVMRRGRGEGPQLAGDGLRGQPADVLRRRAEEAVATARALDRARVGDVCVDTGGRSVREVARLVRASAGGWPNGTDHGRRGGG
ncbi:MAG: AAA family ATPase [Mycobacteriales bacterium]